MEKQIIKYSSGKFLNRQGSLWFNSGRVPADDDDELDMRYGSPVYVQIVVGLMFLDSCFCWIITDINPDMLPESVFYNAIVNDEVEGSNDVQSMPRRINMVFPGTKWCGAGNVAESIDDLGSEKEADMCCRDHDNCPGTIPGGETMFNLTNEAFYSRLSCECDLQFYSCMKTANTWIASYIGFIYFDMLRTECYREDYPVTSCAQRGGWFRTKCVQYSYDTSKDKIHQWFDVPSWNG